MNEAVKLSSSYRDPSGFLFIKDQEIYRAVSSSYAENFNLLMSSGLYTELVNNNYLIEHQEISEVGEFYKIIKPKKIKFISYPYEWCFSQLKAAALLTLKIQEISLKYGMTLKDASAFNVQFNGVNPIFIDTLSFEKYEEGSPWVAYRQFCEHFLAPLSLMSYVDVRLLSLFTSSIDGVPLDLASKLLPWKTKFSLGLATHIHLHAKAQLRHASSESSSKAKKVSMSKTSFLGLLDNLKSTIQKLTWNPVGTEWADYYSATNYTNLAADHKAELISTWLSKSQGEMAWDFGANTGVYTKLLAEHGYYAVGFDIDPCAVEKHFRFMPKEFSNKLLPLKLDLINPSPSIGWALKERDAISERGKSEVLLALALIHHIAISHNVPLTDVAEFFAKCTKKLIIEFVPKDDSQVKKLLSSRLDIFPDYTETGFEQAFLRYFNLENKSLIKDSCRTLYCFTVK